MQQRRVASFADSEAGAVSGLAGMVEKEVRKRVERVCERWHHLAHLQRRMGGARRRPGTLLGEHCPYIMQLASRQSQSRIALYGLNCEKIEMSGTAQLPRVLGYCDTYSITGLPTGVYILFTEYV